MTVQELIDTLKKYPPSATVLYSTYEYLEDEGDDPDDAAFDIIFPTNTEAGSATYNRNTNEVLIE